MSLKKLFGAGFVLALATACTSTYTTKDPAFTELYGPVSAVAGGAENARYARFLAEGSAPAEMSVRPRDGGAPQAFFAADVAVVLRQESGVPLVSLNIKPHNYGPEELAALPPFIEGKVQTARGGPAIEFVVRLPDDRTPDSAGLIRTGWSLCPDCIGLDDSGTKVVQSRKLGSARVVAAAGVGAAANPELRFVESPARRVMLGEEADPALAVFAEAEARREAERKRLAAIEAEKARIAKEKAEEEERLYGDQRRAYAAFVKENKGSPLARARAAKCGKLKLRGTPNSRNADRSDYSGRMKQNAQRFEKHVGCVTDFLETADYASLAEEAAAAETREEELFIAANLPGDDRGVIFTLDAMIEEEDAYLKKTADRFEDTAEDFEDGWKDFVEVQEERARERAAKRRRAKIEQETTNCLMGLAAGGNLTPYSQGYCKAQAERGISGLAAARMGSAGSSSSTSSSNTSSLLYTRPQMPTFDLQGMMDNARVAAETGNTSVLWDKSGAIRTSRAPNLPRPSVTSHNRSDERRTSSRNSRGAVSASDSSSAIEKARSAAAEAAEKASATARAEEERVAASEQEREEVAKAEAEAAAKAEAEAKEQERAERAAAEAEAEKAREAAAERERQEKEAARRLAELSKPVARSGGSLGCVGVVDTKRIPGSSALSSCPYSQPDREALFITFVNRCTFPVNIEVDLAYDTGESRKSGEYDVKPGRNRKTVGHCGATNYDYRYEETRDSLSSRGG